MKKFAIVAIIVGIISVMGSSASAAYRQNYQHGHRPVQYVTPPRHPARYVSPRPRPVQHVTPPLVTPVYTTPPRPHVELRFIF